MNWLVLTVGLIFILCIAIGAYRGAVRIAVSLATTLLTLVIVFFAAPYVAGLIEDKTPLDDMIQDQVLSTMAGAATSQAAEAQEEGGISEDAVRKALKAAGISEETLESYGISVDDIVSGKISSEALEEYGISSGVLEGATGDGGESVENIIENADIPRDVQIAAIEAAELPELFKNLLTENNNDEIYEDLGVETFAQYVGSFLSKLIIHMIAFLSTFIVVTIVLRAIVFALDIVANLPVLGTINRIAGAGAGFVGALVIVWTLFIILTLLYTTSFGKEAWEMIQGNTFTKMIYEWNPLMKLAINL